MLHILETGKYTYRVEYTNGMVDILENMTIEDMEANIRDELEIADICEIAEHN
jgi:hypothetical protein